MSPQSKNGDDDKRIAIALKYDESGAPRVIAKGEGFISDEILKAAAAHGVPIEANPLLAQALSQVELDEEIPEELYQAVAVIIGFILRSVK